MDTKSSFESIDDIVDISVAMFSEDSRLLGFGCWAMMYNSILLILGAHAQEGYGTCLVSVSVCPSVTTLAAALVVSVLKIRHVEVSLRLFLDSNSWIFAKKLSFKSYGVIYLPKADGDSYCAIAATHC